MSRTDKYSVSMSKLNTVGINHWIEAVKKSAPYDVDPNISKLISRYVYEGLKREGFISDEDEAENKKA